VHRSKGLEFPLVYLPEAWERHVSTADEGGHPAAARPPGAGPVGGVSAPSMSAAAGVRDGRPVAPEPGRGRRGGPAAVLRRRHPSPVPARHLVGPVAQHARIGPAAVALPAHRRGGQPAGAGVRPRGRPVQRPRPRTADRARDPRRSGPDGLAAAAARTRCADRPGLRPGAGHRVAPTSYSGLTAAAHGGETAVAGVASEAEPAPGDDEAATAAGPDGRARFRRRCGAGGHRPRAGLAHAALPMGGGVRGRVHAVLEAVDPQAQDLAYRAATALRRVLARLPVGSFKRRGAGAGLAPAFATRSDRWPVAAPWPTSRARDRLAELGFELPLAGGEVTRADVSLADLVPLLREHLPPTTRWCVPRRPGRSGPGRADLARLPHRQHRRRAAGAGPTATRATWSSTTRQLARAAGRPPADRRSVHPAPDGRGDDPGALPAAGAALRGRGAPAAALAPAGYDPDRHLVECSTCSCAGMAGPATPVVDGVPCGVFSWRPPGRWSLRCPTGWTGDPA
jgi:exodeoxyribonuclease V beta subunit